MKKTPDIVDQEVKFTPDFLNIPSIVAFDNDLQPLDKLVYGVVFWLERLKDGKCYASNATIAKVVSSSASGVRHALSRLNAKGYISCVYDNKNQRKEIKTLVFNTVNPVSNETGGVSQTSHIDSNTKKKTITSETLTEIKKVYVTWLKVMVVDPAIRHHGTTDSRHAALETAMKSYRLTPKRKDAIARRLKDAGLPMTLRAVLAISESEFHRGDNDRGWKADLDWLCGSYEKVEEWSSKYKSRKEDQ